MRSRLSAEYRYFRAQLRKAREDAGMTQQEAADAMKVPRTAVQKMEAGDRRVDFVEVLWLAELYGKPLKWFVPPRR